MIKTNSIKMVFEEIPNIPSKVVRDLKKSTDCIRRTSMYDVLNKAAIISLKKRV